MNVQNYLAYAEVATTECASCLICVHPHFQQIHKGLDSGLTWRLMRIVGGENNLKSMLTRKVDSFSNSRDAAFLKGKLSCDKTAGCTLRTSQLSLFQV